MGFKMVVSSHNLYCAGEKVPQISGKNLMTYNAIKKDELCVPDRQVIINFFQVRKKKKTFSFCIQCPDLDFQYLDARIRITGRQ